MPNKPPAKSKANKSPSSKLGSKRHLEPVENKCIECSKVIGSSEQVMFVEEEVGRTFCSEACIIAHFTPEIEKLEREYGKHVTAHDLTAQERERYAHLRWVSIEQPDEIWQEKTVKGDARYTIITEFKPENKTVWSVSICLMLRGEPSLLYLAFITSDSHLVDIFRKGERLKIARQQASNKQISSEQASNEQASNVVQLSESGRLAEPWTEADSLQASVVKNRKSDDISVDDFGFYKHCLEETLQDPNELWSYTPQGAKPVYHFLRHYEQEDPFWYVVMAKDTEDSTQIEIIEAFPTRDASLVQLCRHGEQEQVGDAARVESELLATGTSGKRQLH